MNFSKDFSDYLLTNVQAGKEEIAERMKIVLYKTIPDHFDLLDFDNDDIFLDPLLFAYFNSDNKTDPAPLLQLLYGSMDPDERPSTIKVQPDKYGNIYLPRLGWISNREAGKTFSLESRDRKFYLDGVPVQLEPLPRNNVLNVELIKYPLELLADRFYDGGLNLVEVDVNRPFNRFNEQFNKSLNFIAGNVSWLAELIKKCCFKSVIFDDGTDPINDPFCIRNSFASFRVKSVSFHNSYQPWYDEVFFLDDISHQMGHIIFDYLINNKKRFYKIDPESVISANSDYGKKLDKIEERTYEVVFHALFTFFLELNVLDACIENAAFSERQMEEIKGRIGFYIRKSALDFEILEDFEKNEIASTIYTAEGMYIYTTMKKSFTEIMGKYHSYYESYQLNNQTYNYNHRKFLELNHTQPGILS